MTRELENPFSVTKATEFSDQQINDYWVNFNAANNVSFEPLLNPTEYLPKYVVGGKGCGKTHLLRYFSFPLQLIRHDNNPTQVLVNDGYVGLYSVFSGLNSSRFQGKKIDDVVWETVFEYYFELYISGQLLETVSQIFYKLDRSVDAEDCVLSNVKALFNRSDVLQSVHSIDELIQFVNDLRRRIDSEVMNAAFTRALNYEDVRVLFSPGDLLFGIPAILSEVLADFRGIKFIYIFDEYEKFFEWQKRFVNSLVADKRTPVTFWIGARRYGYTTRATKSGEEMKGGSEFQEVDLDTIIRDNESLYKGFADRLFATRLKRFLGETSNDEDVDLFRRKFEKYDETKLIEDIKNKNTHREFKHLRDLRSKISRFLMSASNGPDSGLGDRVVQAIQIDTLNNPLEQKLKLFRFYFLWHEQGSDASLDQISEQVAGEYYNYLVGTTGPFKDIREKRKKDLLAQLAKENDIKNTEFSGVDQFIHLSHGNPRSFLLILKKVIEFSKVKGEQPLSLTGFVSLDSQYLAVYETAKWFFQDAEVVDEDGRQMYVSLKNLTDYFVQERFCDKPVETTLSSFFINEDELSSDALECIDLMKMHALLIEDEAGRIGKTSGRKQRKFQINRTMAPYWNLPTVIRGTLLLRRDLAEAIFNHSYHDKFQSFFRNRRAQLNAPDFVEKKDIGTQEGLF